MRNFQNNTSRMYVNNNFEKLLSKIALERIKNNIDDKLRSSTELTKMILNAPSMQQVIKELCTIPRKEDIDKFAIKQEVRFFL